MTRDIVGAKVCAHQRHYIAPILTGLRHSLDALASTLFPSEALVEAVG